MVIERSPALGLGLNKLMQRRMADTHDRNANPFKMPAKVKERDVL